MTPKRTRWLRVADARGRKPPGDVLRHPAPRQVVRLTAAFENAPPQPPDLPAEDAKARAITGNAVITDMPGNDRTQIGTLFRERQVHALPEFGFHRYQLRVQPGSHRLPPHREPALPGLRTTVRLSRPVGLHHRPLAEPDVNLSAHPAPIRQTYRSYPAANARRDPACRRRAVVESGSSESCDP